MSVLGRVRAAVARWGRSVRPRRTDLRRDTVAGLPGAIASIPDGMASAVLVGVNPVHGLYASIVGPVAGGLTQSTRLMITTTTTAAALAAGSALTDVPADDRPAALFLLTLLAGAVMVAAAALRLGRYTRFVSHSVMTGFLTGVSVNIVAGQLADLTGSDAEGSTSVAKGVDVLLHPGRVDLASLLVGVLALVILFGLSSGRLASFSALIALVVPSLVVIVFGLDSVATVDDTNPIPGLDLVPALPDLGVLRPSLVAGAFAVAVIVLVQGAGVSESAPNPGGGRSDANRDFLAQGVANVASSLFRGLPVGGSVGQTALNRSLGARSRWAAILSGLWMLVLVVAFAGLVGAVAMPLLSAVLIYAAIGSVRPHVIAAIWRTGPTSQLAMVTTSVATLVLPVTSAVGIGVALSLILQLNQEALDLRVVELVACDDGSVAERPAPTVLPSHAVTVLNVYGSLLYAGARTLQARLPVVGDARKPVVVLRLRGRTTLGATFFRVLAGCAAQLSAAGGRLYVTGVDHALARTFERAGGMDLTGPVQVVDATDMVGESTRRAIADAQAWLVRHRAFDNPDGPGLTPSG